MKKQTVFSISFVVALMIGGTVFAQTTVSSGATADTDAGGLGKGLSNMVRGILGNDTSPALNSAPAEPSLMMQMSAMDSAGGAAPAPAAMMRMKAANAETTIVPMSDTELSAYIHDLLIQDSNIQSIDSSDSHVRVTYAVPAKVFRVVRVTLRITVSASASGSTDVAYPWYAGLASHVRADFRARTTDALKGLIPQHPFTPDEQRVLIDQIHVLLAGEFGSSTAGDR